VNTPRKRRRRDADIRSAAAAAARLSGMIGGGGVSKMSAAAARRRRTALRQTSRQYFGLNLFKSFHSIDCQHSYYSETILLNNLLLCRLKTSTAF